MIFGFNTDVKSGDTVYHVQTEAHPPSQSFRITIFVRGQCVGKRAIPYADDSADPVTDQQLHEMLKEQHRHTVEAIRQGKVNEALGSSEEQAPTSDFL
jgi:hypothetical protein